MTGMRRCMLTVLTGILVLAGCQSHPSITAEDSIVQPGYTPALQSDEAGLWLVMDRAEKELKTSGRLIRDVEINEYLRKLVCHLARELCADIRVYLVRVPYFNASMAPNGVMQVWSGLLLRVENEAQLTYILGHEITHYRFQHSLQMFRQAKSTANILAPFQVVTSAGGVGYVGSLAELVAVGTLLKFSRDHEREADEGGFEMMLAAGYDPREASKVWEELMEERDALGEDVPNIFLSTHPSSKERVETLNDRARAIAESANKLEIGKAPYEEQLARLRFDLLRDELRLRQFPATEVLLDHLEASGAPAVQIVFYRAELYSARAEEGDMEKAEQGYLTCLKYPQTPAQAYRELGLIYMKTGRGAEAVPLFEAYLRKEPHAFDQHMVKSYIRRIQNKGQNE